MCTEFWNGWFDHWTEEHHSRDPEDAAKALEEILELGGSVSAYMFHGGTNFGYMNGANCYDFYEPTVSSYDDDAPVNEYGDPTEKYFKIREVISKYAPIPDVELPAPVKRMNYGEVRFTKSARLFDVLDSISTPVESVTPKTMEKLGQGYGYVLYKAFVRGPRDEQDVRLQEVHDRGYVYLDGKFVGIQYRNDEKPMTRVAIPAEGAELAVLVENMGRVNYGARLKDCKGITEGIGFGNNFVYHWQNYTLPFDDISKVPFKDGVDAFDGTPVLLKGEFEISEKCDTFVKLPMFKKVSSSLTAESSQGTGRSDRRGLHICLHPSSKRVKTKSLYLKQRALKHPLRSLTVSPISDNNYSHSKRPQAKTCGLLLHPSIICAVKTAKADCAVKRNPPK